MLSIPRPLIWSCLSAFMACLAGCSISEEKTHIEGVEFVLPDGFKGCFKVIDDRKGGAISVDMKSNTRIRVPESGVVRLNDSDKLFARFYRNFTQFEEGPISPGKSGFFSVHPMGVSQATGGTEYWYYVGRESEMPSSAEGWIVGGTSREERE